MSVIAHFRTTESVNTDFHVHDAMLHGLFISVSMGPLAIKTFQREKRLLEIGQFQGYTSGFYCYFSSLLRSMTGRGGIKMYSTCRRSITSWNLEG
jgi:hypothetical protein